jgi:diguanylate cyclase (GGDEF)-like protein
VADDQGRLVASNKGFRQLLPAADGDDMRQVAHLFQSPGWGELAEEDADATRARPSYRGPIVVANDAGDTRTLTASVWRVPEGLLVFAERDHSGLAAPDPLTGLGNRSAWDQAVAAELARAERYGAVFSIILAEIDHFKDFSDQHGRVKSETMLRNFADVLVSSTRRTDSVYRIGDELFVVFMPYTRIAAADMIAGRIRARFEETAKETSGEAVTGSFGVADLHEGERESDILGRAHSALVRAKQAGHNRVMTAAAVTT